MMQSLETPATNSLTLHVESLLEDLIPEFLEDRKEDVETMAVACGQGDYETIRTLGHDMKGSGGGYGFDAITDIGRNLEQSAIGQSPDEVRQLLGILSTYLERVEVVYV